MTRAEFLFWLVIAVPPALLIFFAMFSTKREARPDPMASAHGDVPHVHRGENFR